MQHRLKVYQEKGLDEKLKKQTSCNTDLVRIDSLSEWLDELIQSLESAYSKDGRELLSIDNYVSQYNSEIFDDLNPLIVQANASIDAIKQDIDTLKKYKEKISLVREKLILKIDSLKDEFAEIKREINDEQLDADSYVSDQKKLAANNEKIAKLKENLKSKDKLCSAIKKDLLIAMSCFGRISMIMKLLLVRLISNKINFR